MIMYKVISSKRGTLGQYDTEEEANNLAEFYAKDDYYGKVYVVETYISRW